jgi:ParB family transcriptional regulator, chromosome partitioning protein
MAQITNTALDHINPDLIDKNPVNPRLIFREAEMNQLLDSIREVGIQVPLSVYSSGKRFVLLDGERRWRCAKKLNLKTVPVLIQPQPSPLENLLTMFNIHNVRTDWDLMPMALKLKDVKELLVEAGQSGTPKALSAVTGVSLPTVRRALELLELPKRYQKLLLDEGKKPRDQQTITADLFVEVNKSKRVIEQYQPQVFEEVSEEQFVDGMIDKYREGVVNNVVRFRDISKIARVERTGGDPAVATPALVRLVRDKSYKIETAYQDTVESAYVIRDVGSRISSLKSRLDELDRSQPLPPTVVSELRDLRSTIDELLEGY